MNESWSALWKPNSPCGGRLAEEARQTHDTVGRIRSVSSTAAPNKHHKTPAAASPATASRVRSWGGQKDVKLGNIRVHRKRRVLTLADHPQRIVRADNAGFGINITGQRTAHPCRASSRPPNEWGKHVQSTVARDLFNNLPWDIHWVGVSGARGGNLPAGGCRSNVLGGMCRREWPAMSRSSVGLGRPASMTQATQGRLSPITL